MNVLSRFCLVSLLLTSPGLTSGLWGAEGVRPVDLAPFLGKDQFQTVGADWLLPRGRQVVEGVPFQVDGIVEVAGTSARFSNVGRTNIDNIPVGGTFDRLYLLAAASRDVKEGVALGRVTLRFADGARSDLTIEYGRHVLDWMGPRHKGESPLIEPDARVAWQAQHPAAARRDDSLRLFYMSLPNPSPDKEVRALDLVSMRARGGLMVAAISVGPEQFEKRADTLPRVEEHFHIEGAPGGKPVLTGRVYDADVKPVAGALVRVMSVKPVDKTDQLTPADSELVGREARTDSAGRYQLGDLSERLLYQVLFASPDSPAVIFDGADPLAGPANVRLPAASGGAGGQFYVHARVIGPDDKPVVGASVKPDGVGTGTSTSWGSNSGFPKEAVTALNGEFIMAREERFTRLSVDLKAPGLAPAKVWLPASNGVHTIRLGVGATLTGRVLKDGRPLADVELGVSGRNRSSEVYAGHYETKTDAEGRFRFEHLPPKTEWYCYGLIRSLRRDGSLPPRPVSTPDHGESENLGDLAVQPGVTVAGQLKTKDGQPLPSGLRLTMSFDEAWDSQSARIDRAGAFEATGLPPGVVSLYLGSPDWTFSGENRSLDDWNPRQLTGMVKEDKRDLIVLIEKRPRDAGGYYGNNGNLPESDRARNRPLSGVEDSGPPAIVLAGVVVDDQSDAPVPNARITPGRKPPSAPSLPSGTGLLQTLIEAMQPRVVPWNERPYWEHRRAEIFPDGRFFIANRALSSQPMLRVEADGYNVLETAPVATSQTNLTLRLKKGSGPAGILIGPDGRPAANVTIVFGGDQQQFSLSPEGTLSSYGDQRSTVVTKADGGFAFPSISNGRRVFAANQDGWLNIQVQNWPADGRLRLAAWSRATGILMDKEGKPAPNVQVAIELVRDYQNGDPWVNFQDRPATDAQGRFNLERVPPGELRLVHLVPMKGSGWMHAFQTNFTAAAGKQVDLGRMGLTPQPPGVY